MSKNIKEIRDYYKLMPINMKTQTQLSDSQTNTPYQKEGKKKI